MWIKRKKSKNIKWNEISNQQNEQVFQCLWLKVYVIRVTNRVEATNRIHENQSEINPISK